MKFLRNQGFVILLAAIAVVLVGKNLVWPFLGPKFARRNAAAPAAAAATPADTANKQPPVQSAASVVEKQMADALSIMQKMSSAMTKTTAPASQPMNLAELRAQGGAWIVAPIRDPFKLRGSINDKAARDQIKLTGILRQTDSDLAVLNNQVMAVGETILGFRVETVEADRVWVSGPNGREVLEFRYSVPETKPAGGAELVTSTEPVTAEKN